MKVNFDNKMVGGVNYEFIRGNSTQQAGAAEFGECMETMEHIHDGNFESWIQAWSVTADRVAAYAQDADRAGDQIALAIRSQPVVPISKPATTIAWQSFMPTILIHDTPRCGNKAVTFSTT